MTTSIKSEQIMTELLEDIMSPEIQYDDDELANLLNRQSSTVSAVSVAPIVAPGIGSLPGCDMSQASRNRLWKIRL